MDITNDLISSEKEEKSNLVGGGDELKNGGEWSRWQNHGKMRDNARLEQRSFK